MFFEKMSDLAGDITFDERKVDELYTKCCAKYELKIRRKRRNYCSMTIIAVILLICMCTTLHNLNSTIVYASGIEGKIQLKEGEKIRLMEEMTPLGRGYTIEISLGKNERFEVIEGLENANAENIFIKEAFIYWMPDGFSPGRITDEKGEDIQINKTNSSVLKVRVHKGEKTEDINLRLERGDKGAYIELLENESGK